MRYHPAILMLMVWIGAFSVFFILPFHLTHREFTGEGIAVLFMFVGAFCLGALAKSPILPRFRPSRQLRLGFARMDVLTKTLSAIACAVFLLEIFRNGALDLGAAYAQRSSQSQALLHGGVSQSSLLFKVGFLSYPASYVYIVRKIIFDQRIKYASISLFGLLPGVLAAVAMGGRSPLLITLAYTFVAYLMRRGYSKQDVLIQKPQFVQLNPFVLIGAALLFIVAFYYFVSVFVARSLASGGPAAMMEAVGSLWGVTFSGPLADAMNSVLGPGTTYLIFAFVWYLIQGIVMSNTLFAQYYGDSLLGAYGIDLFSAVMRRVDPPGLAQQFNYLLKLDTYGFLPSAYGTLFVDYGYAGLLVAVAWGWLSSLVYARVQRGFDPRWRLFAPFVVVGIVFSLINTPLGFANGFVTHIWLIIGFLLIRRIEPVKLGDVSFSSIESDAFRMRRKP